MSKAQKKSLAEKYQEALGVLEAGEESQVAVLVKQEQTEDGLTIKHRLLMRKTPNSITHVYEILEPESGAMIQIPLLGNWQDVLTGAVNLLESLNMETVKAVVEELVQLRPSRKKKSIKEL